MKIIIKITIKNPKKYTDLVVFKEKPVDCIWDNEKKEFSFNANSSPKEKSWRLVYKEGKVIYFDESEGVLITIWDLFCGTKEDCLKEIEKLKLEPLPDEDAELQGMEQDLHV